MSISVFCLTHLVRKIKRYLSLFDYEQLSLEGGWLGKINHSNSVKINEALKAVIITSKNLQIRNSLSE